MMSVKEYANDTNHTVAEILKKCEELGIKVKNGDDFLSDDDIIILDNAINLISSAIDKYMYIALNNNFYNNFIL